MAFLSWQLAVERSENESLVAERDFYQTRLDSYYRDWQDIQFGMWEKLKVGEHYLFLGVNDTYVENYLVPNNLRESDVIGKNNIQLFGEYVGGGWKQNDSVVAYSGKQVTAVELVQYGEQTGYVFISKWRKIRRNGDTTIIGLAVKMDTIQQLYINRLKKENNQ